MVAFWQVYVMLTISIYSDLTNEETTVPSMMRWLIVPTSDE